VLGGDDGLDHRREIVDIGQRLDAEQDIVEGRPRDTGGFFGCSDHCGVRSGFTSDGAVSHVSAGFVTHLVLV